jgi:hypothetical protein
MCRMILAVGDVAGGAILDAALLMSTGEGACHEYAGCRPEAGRALRHHDGWGAVYLTAEGNYRCLKSERPIVEDEGALELRRVATRALAVHVRNASIDSKKGLDYVHPIVRDVAGREVFFFHNGFAPDVHRLLGRSESRWDSLELFDWLIAGGGADWEAGLSERLARLPASTTAANFILAEPGRVTVCNWFPEGSPTPNYYTMHCYQGGGATVVSSEPVAGVGPLSAWRPVANRSVLTLAVPPGPA